MLTRSCYIVALTESAWSVRRRSPSRDNKPESRASVLRRVAASVQPNTRHYNTAYVLTHYFAYLRRNLEDAPDYNLVGFNFWLDDLNRTGDYRSVSRVFIESGEYKDRGRRQEQSAGKH